MTDFPIFPIDTQEVMEWYVRSSQDDIVSFLKSEHYKKLVHWRMSDGFTVLHAAAKFHHADVLRQLDALGVDLSETDHSGDGALQYALHYFPEYPQYEIDTLEFLLRAELARPENSEGQSQSIVKVIADRHWMSSARSPAQWVAFAIEQGAPIFEWDPYGHGEVSTPLHDLMKDQYEDILVHLLETEIIPASFMKETLRELDGGQNKIMRIPQALSRVRAMVAAWDEGLTLNDQTVQVGVSRNSPRL